MDELCLEGGVNREEERWGGVGFWCVGVYLLKLWHAMSGEVVGCWVFLVS